MQGFIFLNGVKYPVFVDMLTANFESDCVAIIQAPNAVNGWIQGANGVDYNTTCTYVDYNGKFRVKAKMHGQSAEEFHNVIADALKA